jgi:drug/metabolite transporter (DMT)-like permease
MRGLTRVDVMLALTVLIWAFNITVTRYVLTHGFRPLAYGAIRYGAAALLAAGVAFGLERSLAVGGRRTLLLIGLASGFLLINQFAFAYALKLGTATTVALILGTTPIFAAIFSSLTGLERLSAQFWIAAAIGFAGVGLVALGSGGNLSSDLVFAFLILSEHLRPLQVVGGFTILAGIVLERRWRRRLGPRSHSSRSACARSRCGAHWRRSP